MKTNELKVNLKNVLEKIKIYPPDHRDENIQADVEYIFAYGKDIEYSKLISLYEDGLTAFMNSLSWREDFSCLDELERVLALACGLLLNYSLPIKDYYSWVKNQDTIYESALLLVANGNTDKGKTQQLVDYLKLNYVKSLMPEDEVACTVVSFVSQIPADIDADEAETEYYRIYDQYLKLEPEFLSYRIIDADVDEIAQDIQKSFLRSYSGLVKNLEKIYV